MDPEGAEVLVSELILPYPRGSKSLRPSAIELGPCGALTLTRCAPVSNEKSLSNRIMTTAKRKLRRRR